jgi:uncharacterized protein YndB with AHSA1/START domain
MWKWIGGCLLVGTVLLGFGLWSGYRKLASFGPGDGTEAVMIGAPVGRVFASLADADSLSGWMGERNAIKVRHHGMLVPGDTLQVEMRNRFNFGPRPVNWTVSDVTPNQLLSLQLRSDSSGKLIARRQFTLAPKGESTQVASAVTAPFLDSVRARRSDTIKASDAYIDVTSKLLVSGLRMQSHIELQQLKTRIEGRSGSRGQR